MTIVETVAGPCQILLLKTNTESVVSWRGSFVTNPDIVAGENNLQVLATSLLDKGTRLRDRFKLAEALELRGAGISFWSDGARVSLRGTALREDVADVLAIAAEMLRQPLLSDKECDKEKVGLAAVAQQARESTAFQAQSALLRQIYPQGHVNYDRPLDELMAWLDQVAPSHVRTYHARHFKPQGMVLAFAGDLNMDDIAKAVEDAFGDWSGDEWPGVPAVKVERTQPASERVHIAGKSSLDVRLGHAIDIVWMGDEYLPLLVANHVLGGNFSARLMRNIRGKMGLTYGVYSRLSGFHPRVTGYWSVGLTLSHELYKAGIAAVRDQVRQYVEEGPTDQEVQRSKDAISGSCLVGLSSTSQLAGVMHKYTAYGLPVSNIQSFPAGIARVTAEEVRESMASHFDPGALHLTVAGDMD